MLFSPLPITYWSSFEKLAKELSSPILWEGLPRFFNSTLTHFRIMVTLDKSLVYDLEYDKKDHQKGIPQPEERHISNGAQKRLDHMVRGS